MNWKVALSDLRVSDRQRAAVNDVLDSGWLSMGPRTAAFESAFAEAAAVEHAVAVSSGTTGLLLALQAVGVGPKDEVVLPSLTFVADANVVRQLGATPVFADIMAVDRPVADPQSILSRVTRRTKAVIVVHYAGASAEVEPLLGHGFAVIEDAAHAVGPVDDSAWLRLRGDLAVFSFFANKNLALGEGGMVSANRGDLDAALRLLRAHGMTASTWDRHQGHASDYDVVTVGTNGRITEVQAALGEAGLPDLPAHNATRRRLLRKYAEMFEGSAVSLALRGDPSTGHLAVAVLPGTGQRPRIRAALADAGIQTSFHYPPIHKFAAFGEFATVRLPATEEAEKRLMTLPLHPYLSEDGVELVASTLLDAL
ncbi:MAG TPA: DegT/DnrJ/EryC1/StrS aminotransferase family protein [Mycobacteriales bacterium]|nr:DegT/DnrJ/EryC1/StrS aminotransferase family protein [Mycobacteriales bacterium]